MNIIWWTIILHRIERYNRFLWLIGFFLCVLLWGADIAQLTKEILWAVIQSKWFGKEPNLVGPLGGDKEQSQTILLQKNIIGVNNYAIHAQLCYFTFYRQQIFHNVPVWTDSWIDLCSCSCRFDDRSWRSGIPSLVQNYHQLYLDLKRVMLRCFRTHLRFSRHL